MMYFDYNAMPFGWFGWVFMLLWWVLIIIGVVFLIKWILGQTQGRGAQGKIPIDILKERYARGEISKQEFEEKKKDLV